MAETGGIGEVTNPRMRSPTGTQVWIPLPSGVTHFVVVAAIGLLTGYLGSRLGSASGWNEVSFVIVVAALACLLGTAISGFLGAMRMHRVRMQVSYDVDRKLARSRAIIEERFGLIEADDPADKGPSG